MHKSPYNSFQHNFKTKFGWVGLNPSPLATAFLVLELHYFKIGLIMNSLKRQVLRLNGLILSAQTLEHIFFHFVWYS